MYLKVNVEKSNWYEALLKDKKNSSYSTKLLNEILAFSIKALYKIFAIRYLEEKKLITWLVWLNNW